jgi:4-hydroxybenzoate polyprenyltransferase
VILALLRSARPHQWVKNLFVAAPLVFAKELGNGAALLRGIAAFVAFCAISSAVYLVNDVIDVEKDRAHPTKRNRPIASGALSPHTAIVAAVVLAIGSIGGGIFLSPYFAAVAAGYFVLFLAYSLQIKHIAFVDVTTIAVGFLLRVLAGAFAIHVEPSPWLLACTGLVAAYLGFGKRAHELAQALSAAEAGHEIGKTRDVLSRYKHEHLRGALYLFGLATCVAYVFYTQAAHTVTFFGTKRMIFTAPFCVIGIGRFLWLVLRKPPLGDSPTDAMLRDGPFLANAAVWGAAVLAIIYFG